MAQKYYSVDSLSLMDIELMARRFYDYSLHMPGYSPETIKRYKRIIDFYCRFAKLKNIEDITDANLRELFTNGRTYRNWSPRTFIVYYHSLTVFFKWCVANHCMVKNPITEIELPRVEKRLPLKLTKQDAMKLLEVVYNYPYDQISPV